MASFATLKDLEADGRSLSDEGVSDEAANTLIERVSAFLAQMLSDHGISVDPCDEIQQTNLTTVTCYIVWDEISKRKTPDFSSLSQSVGSTNVSFSLREKSTGFYVPPDYRTLLGIRSRGGFKSLRVAIHKPDGTLVDGW